MRSSTRLFSLRPRALHRARDLTRESMGGLTAVVSLSDTRAVSGYVWWFGDQPGWVNPKLPASFMDEEFCRESRPVSTR
jgi:hypothetical protein